MTDGGSGAFGNGPSTPVKLARVAKLVPWVVRMSARHVQRYGGCFWYLEANHGPGAYQAVDGRPLEGSPILALRVLRELDIPYRAVLIDHDPEMGDRLKRALAARHLHDPRRVVVQCADNRIALPVACAKPSGRRDRGLVFFDAKGDPDWGLVDVVTGLPTMRGVDALVNVPTNLLKLERCAARSARYRGVGRWAAKDTRPLMDILAERLHKPRRLIGEPTPDSLAWSLILGSSWLAFPEWRAGGLDAADSPVGRARLLRISLTERERKEDGGN